MTDTVRDEDLLNPYTYVGKCDTEAKMKIVAFVREHGPRLSGPAKELGISHKTIAIAMKADPLFEEAVREAEQEYVAGLETEIHRRAVDGVEEPVFYQGIECGRISRYSDSLLTLMIKRHDHSYREKLSADVSIGGGVLVIAGKHGKSDKDWAKQFGPDAVDEPDEEPSDGSTLNRS